MPAPQTRPARLRVDPIPWPRLEGCARRAATLLLALVVLPLVVAGLGAQTGGRAFYVAPNGAAGNDGSLEHPLTLAAALATNSPARPGDTIWLRGGTYVGNFTSNLTGTPSAPIIVRQYPGERATVDGNTSNRAQPALTVRGADTWYWGFEVTDSNPQRVNAQGFNNPVLRATSVDVHGPRTKFINLVVHDGLQGFGFWTPAVDAEIYGSLIYNVGVEAPDRGHGHSIYTQNQTGTKHIRETIMFNGFSFGIHAYTEGGAIDNFRFEGNIAFNHGLLSPASGAKGNILLGGGRVAQQAVIRNNYTYSNPNAGGRGLDIGYVTPCASPTIEGNYLAGGSPLVLNCTNAVVTGNTLYGSIPNALRTTYPTNTFHTTRPTGLHVQVRPNQYEEGRGHIIIYNWDRASSVSVDLSPAGLQAGDTFEIRDAQNYFGAPVVAGTYSGAPVGVPMTGLTAVAPIGNAPVSPPHTGPDFGVFILHRTGTAPPAPDPPPDPPPTPPPAPPPPEPPTSPPTDPVPPTTPPPDSPPGEPPSGDADGDGLPDAWESQYGLAPNDAAGINGANGDPDNDGVSNAVERQRATHPRGLHKQYLAEGVLNTFFTTRFAIANPQARSARVLLTFVDAEGAARRHYLDVPARSRRTVESRSFPELEGMSFSTTLESDEIVALDRLITWNGNAGGMHSDAAVTRPSPSWYFAEGSTGGPFELFYLLQNPNDVAADVQVRYLLPDGTPPLIKRYTVQPHSRYTIWVDAEEALSATDVSAEITSLTGAPIIAERSMYLNTPRAAFRGGHNSAGVTASATRWFLAEGATGTLFRTYVLLANATNDPAEVRITYLRDAAEPIAKTYTVGANSRRTLDVANEDERLSSTALAVLVQSTNGVPLIVERTMWWPGVQWSDGHNAFGTTSTGSRWLVAEGEAGGASGFASFVLIANTSEADAVVDVTLLFEDAPEQTTTYTVGAQRRLTVPIETLPSALGKRFAVLVESRVATGALVVERAMYRNTDDEIWGAGACAVATQLP